CRGAGRHVAARRPRFSDLDRNRGVLSQSVEPIRARGWRAVFGSDHHPGFGPGFWHRNLLGPVDRKTGSASPNLKGGSNERLAYTETGDRRRGGRGAWVLPCGSGRNAFVV